LEIAELKGWEKCVDLIQEKANRPTKSTAPKFYEDGSG